MIQSSRCRAASSGDSSKSKAGSKADDEAEEPIAKAGKPEKLSAKDSIDDLLSDGPSKPAKGKSRSGNPAKRAAIESGAVDADQPVDEPFDVSTLPPELRNLLG